MNNLNLEFYLPTELWVLIFDKINYHYKGIPLHIKFVCKSWYDIFIHIPKFTKIERDYCTSIASNGYLELLKWAKQNGYPWNQYTFANICKYAAKYGHLEMLKWAKLNECWWNKYICSKAAYGGHLEILKWARKNECPWNEYTCSNAAKNNHLEVLKWARKKGCPWNENTK